MRIKSAVLFISLFALTAMSAMGSEVCAGEQTLIKTGDTFPDIPLQAPEDPELASYLGVQQGKGFMVKDVPADLVLVEIMNVYCASCWRQTPVYNELFALIQADPKTKDKIKMMAVAVGNKDWEVKYFRQKFEVPFPVFPDPDFIMHEAIGGSKTPFSIFVRRDPAGEAPVVANTHLGFIREHDTLFKEMQSLMTADIGSLREKGQKTEAQVVQVKPVLTEKELEAKIMNAFSQEGQDITGFEKMTLEKTGVVYTGLVESAAQKERLFAKVVSRPPPCDVCHDIHYIYVFDASGTIRQFIPIQLTKYGNRHFSEADIAKTRDRIVGRPINKPFHFDAKVDAVTRATITSAVIFKALNDGQALFKELKGEGVI